MLEIPVEPLLFSGTATVRAQTTGDSTLTPVLPAANLTVQGGGPLPAGYNARATSRIEGLQVLGETLEGVLDPLALLAVGVVESEALVSCVNFQPVFVTGSRLAGPVAVAGLDITDTVDDVLQTVVDTLNATGLVEARSNVVNPVPGGFEVIALQVDLLDGTALVKLAQSQISGGVCAPPPPECSDGIDNDGDGLIDAADPGCWTDPNDPSTYDPNDDSEANILPRTGGNNALLGATILAGGALLLETQRRRRAKAAHIQ